MHSQDKPKSSDSEDPLKLGEAPQTITQKTALVIFAVVLTAAMGTAGWRYRRVQGQPAQSPVRPSPRIAAVVALDTSRVSANADQALESHETAKPTAADAETEIPIHPMDQFRDEARKALAQQLSAFYTNVPDLNHEAAKGVDADYRDSVFQFLDAAEKAPAAEQPAMFLAADFMLQAVWCPSEQKIECDQLREQFAKHDLTFVYSELGGGSYYQHDLLWRIWKDFPETDWGERTFVLLLDSGWDTSGKCVKGADQFREVIHQGESFLQQHPNSPYRDFVVHLVGQAYATWWAVGNEPSPAMVDYVDPKLYREGSEDARIKAVASFEQTLQLSPKSPLTDYAEQFLPTLRQQQLTVDSYRFFCVYD